MLGRPLIGTDAGGTREVLSAEGGVLVSHEPQVIATALERLIDDVDLRLSLGAGARAHALRQYDLANFVEGHIKVINEVLQCAGRR